MYLGTITPFKGIRVYTQCVMGQPGSSELLQELLTRVLGDFITQGFLIIKDDNMYVGAHYQRATVPLGKGPPMVETQQPVTSC